MHENESENPAKALVNIGAVTRMTGIPIASLHAWERRYGFPSPTARTPGGHRLYSKEDIRLLRAVNAQIEKGISVSQAVRLVQESEESESQVDLEKGSQRINSVTGLQGTVNGLVDALIRQDLTRADRILGEMLAVLSPEDITLNVIGPALAELGEAWAAGRISVSDEHLASNYLRQRLLMWLVTGPVPHGVDPVLLACAPGEWHEGSLLMLGVMLRRQGWPVVYLGQNLPVADLASFITQMRPAAVVLVAMMEETAQALADWPKWININEGKPVLAFAGRAFVIKPELKRRVSGWYLGDTIQEGLKNLTTYLDQLGEGE